MPPLGLAPRRRRRRRGTMIRRRDCPRTPVRRQPHAEHLGELRSRRTAAGAILCTSKPSHGTAMIRAGDYLIRTIHRPFPARSFCCALSQRAAAVARTHRRLRQRLRRRRRSGTGALAELTLAQPSVTGGQPTEGTVVLAAPAGRGGVYVALSSSNAAAATVPVSVGIPEGSTRGTFPINTDIITTEAAVTITAASAGENLTATLRVVAANARTEGPRSRAVGAHRGQPCARHGAAGHRRLHTRPSP